MDEVFRLSRSNQYSSSYDGGNFETPIVWVCALDKEIDQNEAKNLNRRANIRQTKWRGEING